MGILMPILLPISTSKVSAVGAMPSVIAAFLHSEFETSGVLTPVFVDASAAL